MRFWGVLICLLLGVSGCGNPIQIHLITHNNPSYDWWGYWTVGVESHVDAKCELLQLMRGQYKTVAVIAPHRSAVATSERDVGELTFKVICTFPGGKVRSMAEVVYQGQRFVAVTEEKLLPRP